MSNQHNLESLNKVWETKALVTYPNSAEAKKLLDKLAATVAPLMARRKWKVPILKEFFPSNPNLLGLNVNRGASILIRLRPASDKNSFYDWEHCLGTMIHELTHIQISPHDASFYRLMDELDAEIQKDISKGLVNSAAAEHFSGQGHRLGGSTKTTTTSLSKEMRAKAAADAALSRLGRSRLSAGSGSRLGGNYSENLTKDELRQRAAEAALRRIKDDTECGSNWSPTVDRSYDSHSSSDKAVSSSATASSGRLLNSTTIKSRSDDKSWKCSLCDTTCSDAQDCCTFCFSYRFDCKDSTDNWSTAPSPSSSFVPESLFDGDVCKPCGVPGTISTTLSSNQQIIDLCDEYQDDSGIIPRGSPTNFPLAKVVSRDLDTDSIDMTIEDSTRFVSSGWQCQVCTFLNSDENVSVCEMCQSLHHPQISSTEASVQQLGQKPFLESLKRPAQHALGGSIESAAASSNSRYSAFDDVECDVCTYLNTFDKTLGARERQLECQVCGNPLRQRANRASIPHGGRVNYSAPAAFDPFKPLFGTGGGGYS